MSVRVRQVEEGASRRDSGSSGGGDEWVGKWVGKWSVVLGLGPEFGFEQELASGRGVGGSVVRRVPGWLGKWVGG